MAFEKQEVKALIIASLVSALVFSFNEWGTEKFSLSIGVLNLIRALIITSLIFTFHAYLQKRVAKRFNCTAKFRLLTLEPYKYEVVTIQDRAKKETKIILKPIGLLITLFVTLLSNGKLMLVLLASAVIEPKKISRVGRKFVNIKESEFAQIALAGPIAELILLAVFKLLLPISPLFFQKAMFIAASLAVFNILPIPKMNGGQIFFSSIPIYLFSLFFVILFVISVYQLSIINTLMLSLILSLLISILYVYKIFFSKFL